MLSFPTSTVFERRIPKQKFYQNLDVTAEVKRLFMENLPRHCKPAWRSRWQTARRRWTPSCL